MTGEQPLGGAEAAPPEAELEALTDELSERAAKYGMRTDATDWAKVAAIVQRNRKAAARLARAVDEQALRAIPARRP